MEVDDCGGEMNLQNLPRDDKTVKRAFLPKLDMFIFADYSNIEYRLLAYYCSNLGDDTIAADFRAGADPHAKTAEVLGVAHQPSGRQIGKTYNYSVIYGGGIDTITAQLGITRAQAREYLNRFHAERPGVRVLQNALSSELSSRGYIRTFGGRNLRPDSPHKALNYVLQGSAGDLMRDALRCIYTWLGNRSFQSHLVSTTHDDIGIDATFKEGAAIYKELPYLMTNTTIETIVPITVDIEISEGSWADKRPLNSTT